VSVRATVVVVPGLRDEVPGHWQSLLAQELERVVTLPALGRQNIDLEARVAAIESAVRAIDEPVIIVAHSGGSVATAHWAQRTKAKVLGALLATPPVFAGPLGPEYPALAEFEKQGWLPLPAAPLPFRSFVAASRNDPLGSYEQVSELARRWGAELVDLGEVGHLNPASGFGPWPGARALIERLAS
jgi:uncharacterized protein